MKKVQLSFTASYFFFTVSRIEMQSQYFCRAAHFFFTFYLFIVKCVCFMLALHITWQITEKGQHLYLQ